MKGPHGFLTIHISPERPRLCSVPVPSSTAQREHDRSHIQQSLKTHLVLFKSDRLTLVSRCDDVRLSGGGDSQQIPPTHTRSDVLPEGSKHGAVRAGPGLHQGGSRGTAGGDGLLLCGVAARQAGLLARVVMCRGGREPLRAWGDR